MRRADVSEANGDPKGARLLFAAAIAKQILNRAQQIKDEGWGEGSKLKTSSKKEKILSVRENKEFPLN